MEAVRRRRRWDRIRAALAAAVCLACGALVLASLPRAAAELDRDDAVSERLVIDSAGAAVQAAPSAASPSSSPSPGSFRPSTPVPTPWIAPPPHSRNPMPFTPVMVGGIALIILGISFFWMEASATTHGAFAVAGILCVLAGLAFIFGYTTLAISISWSAVGPLLIAAIAAMTWSVYKGIKHMGETPIGDLREHAGRIVVAHGPLDPAGKVELEGVLWNAVSTRPAPAGAKVRILGSEGLTLKVEPVEDPKG